MEVIKIDKEEREWIEKANAEAKVCKNCLDKNCPKYGSGAEDICEDCCRAIDFISF